MDLILNLKPVNWRQHIRSFQTLGIPGRHLSCLCSVDQNCQIVLKNNTWLREHSVDISIIQHELDAEERRKSGLSERAIGGLWFAEDDDFVHGRFYLDQNSHSGLWDQVLFSGYFACSISMEIFHESPSNERW